MSFSWVYNGTNQLAITATGLIPSTWYELSIFDPDSSTPVSAQTDGSGNLSYLITDIGDPSGADGDPGAGVEVFTALVDQVVSDVDNTEIQYVGANTFSYGTPSTTGFPFGAVWTYDGVKTITVQYPSVTGFTYRLHTEYLTGGSNISSTGGSTSGNGSTQTKSMVLANTPDPVGNYVELRIRVPASSDPTYDFQTGNRLFVGGSTGLFLGNPGTSPSANVGIRIAFANDTHDTSPFWVRIDDPTYPAVASSSNLVSGWETHRGRQYELDKTQAGTATMTIIDQTGRFDPTNTAGPYYGQIKPLKQAKITAQNPVDGSYHDIFTGYVESWDYTITPDENLLYVTANLSDGFELLTRAEVVPDGSGTTTYAGQQVDDRIRAALADAGWPSIYTNIFTGNVDMQQTIYNPQTSILAVIQDAADAEFPNAANTFMDRWGRVAFRGRWARFNPSAYETRDVNSNPPLGAKQIIVWNVGDRAAADTFVIAPIADIQWTLDLKNIINACLCMPYNIAQSFISGQLKTDSGSISQYGVRALSIPDLLIDSSIAGPGAAPPGGDGVGKPAADANTECQIIGQYFVDNYAQPVEMISSISFIAQDPKSTLGPPLWKFLTGVEIGDIVVVTQTNPGGGGFRATQFFVEGIHNVVSLGSGTYPQWTMNLDLTPRTWYSKFDGVTYYP